MLAPRVVRPSPRGRPGNTLWEQDRAASAVPPAGALRAAPRERKETMRPSISLGALVAVTTLLVAVLTTAQPKSPAEIVEERQKVMKQNGDAWKSIQENAKTGNWPVVAANAEIISKNAAKIPSLFPEGSLTDKSKAKPEIWQKWPEVEGTAKKLETDASRQQAPPRAGSGEVSQDIIKALARNACGACHTPFRVPPPRQG